MTGNSGQGATDLTASSVYTIPSDVLFQEVNGEVVTLSMATGNYHGLNEVASRMWHLIQQHEDLESAIAILLEEYDVPEAQLREDMNQLVEQLLSNGLIKEGNE
ncbi:MAG: PqqD family protein [Chloroflexi bacterium]|nr:PqqD family protein [Chloroflexota bacterium]